MKKTTIIMLLLVLHMMNAAAMRYTKADSTTVVALLHKAKTQRLATAAQCQMFFARQLLGIPYVGGTLDRHDSEELVVNLRELDCTTYVETVTALTLSAMQQKYTFSAFTENLRRLRYRTGTGVDYVNRLHYFSDWIDDNTSAGICTEIQAPNPPFTAVQTVRVNYMTRYSSKYRMIVAHPEWKPAIGGMEQRLSGKRYRYIPKSRIDNSALMRSAIHDGDIIAIITNINGLDTKHIGIAAWHSDGLHLINASSIHKKTVEEPMLLSTYLKKHKTMTGIRIVRLK